MEQFTARTLRRAIEFASENENTSIGIFLDNHTTAIVTYRNILDEYRNLYGDGGRLICFPNGSTIKYFSISSAETLRGQRFNIILLHSLIDRPEYRVRISMLEHHEHGHEGASYYYDTETGCYVVDILAYEEPLRGRRASHLIYDEALFTDFRKEFDKWWETKGQFEFNDMVVEFKNAKAPDFGEISPSQELNDFVNTLIQG